MHIHIHIQIQIHMRMVITDCENKNVDHRVPKSKKNAHTHAHGITECQNNANQSSKMEFTDHQDIGGSQSVKNKLRQLMDVEPGAKGWGN